MEKFSEAEKVYKEAIKSNDKDPKLFNNYAVNLKKQGKMNESLDCYKKAIKLDPENANFLYN